jgi:ABC-type uncharacterized transport system involved in gliding motility auxiliary subunit
MTKPKQFLSYVGQRVVVQTVLVVAAVGFGFAFAGEVVARWDLTEDQRFTISDASRRIAGEIEDPLTVRCYFSAKLPERYQPLSQQVFDILEEYEAASGGRIKVERYDPDASEAAKSEAEGYGVQPVQLPVYEATEVKVLSVFGGIVLLYRDKASEKIDVAARYPEGYEGLSVLEYEMSSRIWQLANEKPKLGLCGYLNKEAGMANPFTPQQGPTPEFEGLRKLLGEAFEVDEVDLKQDAPDPAKMPLLLVVRPKEFSDVEVFRLDQYLVKGGRVVMFVTQGTIEIAPWGDQGFAYKGFKTGLDEWLAHVGIRIPDEFVLHYQNCQPIQVKAKIGGVPVQVPIPNWFWPLIGTEDAFDKENPAIRSLRGVTLFWPHPVDVLMDRVQGGTKATVLVRSHAEESWRWRDTSRVDMRALDPQTEGPTSLSSSPLVVAVEGKFQSYFAGRPPPPSLGLGGEEKKEGESEGGEEKEGEEKPAAAPEVVKESADPTQLVVVGNSFFLCDLVLRGREAGDQARQASLLAFNLVDWLARSKDLIALRAKKYTDRALKEGLKDDLKDIQSKFEKGELSQDAAFKEYDRARERQNESRKRWRWANAIVPSLLVIVAGAVVWILRAARRAAPPRIPAPVPPADLVRTE